MALARDASRKSSDSGYFALHRGAKAAEVLHHELGQEVAQLRQLGPVCGCVMLNRLGAAHIVNPDYQRLDIRVSAGGVEVECQQAHGHERYNPEGDLQVRVHHERGSVQLDELPLGVLQGVLGFTSATVAGMPVPYANQFRTRWPTQITPQTKPISAAIPMARKISLVSSGDAVTS